ncbi:ATP-dependent DNA helicase [Paenibacillus hodogayensis]|uniref:ATP-dependent DNA helicase n=1 Tax=Paenibacillus hodogayensis TaxID=279208 RepID=A0ABV5W0W0_9BACL
MPEIVEIAVRPLVEHVYRSGHIESGFRTGEALTEGAKAHRAIQRNYGEADRMEVYVQGELALGEILYRIDGRCDGLLFGTQTEESEAGREPEAREAVRELVAGDAPPAAAVILEEIKSTGGSLEPIGEQTYPVHWAQAKCYAYLYAKAESLNSIRVRLTYVQRTTEEIKRFERTYSFQELERFVLEVLEAYDPYARQQLAHAGRREQSIKALAFPFSGYRQGQRKLAGAAYKSMVDKKRLFARAPTGTGKTISTLFPAVKAIGEGVLRRFFYITAKTTTRTAAEETLGLMRGQGLCLRSVTLTAKEKVCFQEEVRCDKEACPFADGYYDRINGALADLWSAETAVTREVVEAYARKHRVCPFEFSLDAAYAADAVICDYNYVYDPRISLKRLLEEQKRQTAILADEAHNLVDRAREMYSAVLAKAPFLELKRQTREANPALYAAVKAINDAFIALRKATGMTGGDAIILERAPESLPPLLEAFVVQAEAELTRAGETSYRLVLTDAYYAAQAYIRVAGYFNERYAVYAELERSDVRVKLLCVDPSEMLRQAGKGYRSQLFFSATLTPLSYYRDTLGGDGEDYAMAIPSPFRKEQLDVLLLPVSTRYRDRERSKTPIAAMLRRVIAERPGNMLVFFPSYEYMNAVYEQFAETPWNGGDVRVQQSGMTEDERDSFLAAFREDAERPLLAFAVMGGVFAEGIDLTGNRLTGVVVVGVGLPQFGGERDVIRRYYDEAGKNGFDYAYKFPGMNKVLQAGGRLIRTEQDHGILVLADDRFAWPDYEALLPEEWKPVTVMDRTTLG